MPIDGSVFSFTGCVPCEASTVSYKDGSDGYFYCINGGSIGGTMGACTCTCPASTWGTNCQNQVHEVRTHAYKKLWGAGGRRDDKLGYCLEAPFDGEITYTDLAPISDRFLP